jgi:hypothetical protein
MEGEINMATLIRSIVFGIIVVTMCICIRDCIRYEEETKRFKYEMQFKYKEEQ